MSTLERVVFDIFYHRCQNTYMEILQLPFLGKDDCITYCEGLQDLQEWDFFSVSILNHLTGQLPFQEETALILDGIAYSLQGDFREEFLEAAVEGSRRALLDVYYQYKADYQSAYPVDLLNKTH